MLDAMFARLYDPIMNPSEVRGLSRWRAQLVGELTGDVLEIGAGTGLNVPHYGDDVRLVLTEPSGPMRDKLVQRAPRHEVLDVGAEDLPFDDASFDAVVCGLVLCSVRQLDRSLAEIRRVLRSGGRFVFIEHVRSPDAWVRGIQTVVEPVWKIAGRGCHLTRDTESAIREAGFEFEDLDRSGLPGGFFLVRPAIHGVAIRP